MALLTGPDALVSILQANWQPSRSGREDIPDLVRDSNGDPSSEPSDGDGVLILKNREEVNVRQQRHDLIHAYIPTGNSPTITDRGYDEQRITETVQIDIDITDRTDHTTDPPERLSARDRMIGDRAALASTAEPPYGGISGEVQFILESVRRGTDEWDRINYTPIGGTLGNSNATVRWHVDLVELASNTV